MKKSDALPIPPDAEFVSARQAAYLLAVHPRTIWRLVERGDLPQPIRFSRNLTRFRIADVKRFAQVA